MGDKFIVLRLNTKNKTAEELKEETRKEIDKLVDEAFNKYRDSIDTETLNKIKDEYYKNYTLRMISFYQLLIDRMEMKK